MTPGRLLWMLRRDLRRGFRASYHYYVSRERILDWRFPYWALATHPVPIHVLTGEEDWLLAIWMLSSFFLTTKQNWQVFVHDDGTLPSEVGEYFTRAFPSAKVVWREEADHAMEPLLEAYPACRQYRAKHPLALKIFDAAHLSPGPRFMLFDSDVLFFKRPEKILEWANGDTMDCWFNRDVNDTTLITPEEAQSKLGIQHLWKSVNSGLCLLARKALDLDLCEKALSSTTVSSGHIWRIEQTLFAICASSFGKGGLLPETYEVSLHDTARPQCVARHYVGAVRDRFYGEGIERLIPRFWPVL